MAVLANISRSWRAFRRARPGDRFRAAHRNRVKSRKSAWSTWLAITAGAVLIVVGIVALALPGPGSLVIAIGVAFIARESALVARATDAVELRLRRGMRWAKRFWKRAHPAVKVLLVLLAVAAIAAVGWGVWIFYSRPD